MLRSLLEGRSLFFPVIFCFSSWSQLVSYFGPGPVAERNQLKVTRGQARPAIFLRQTPHKLFILCLESLCSCTPGVLTDGSSFSNDRSSRSLQLYLIASATQERPTPSSEKVVWTVVDRFHNWAPVQVDRTLCEWYADVATSVNFALQWLILRRTPTSF